MSNILLFLAFFGLMFALHKKGGGCGGSHKGNISKSHENRKKNNSQREIIEAEIVETKKNI